MAKFQVKRSIQIHAPADQVKTAVTDFNHWVTWSPWLIMDPDTQVDVAEGGKSYQWNGKRTGIGHMELLHSNDDSANYDLTFLKPWKSRSKVRFEWSETNDGTRVTWIMDGTIPIFMIWMKKMMSAFVGNDYERGLAMLKDFVEDGKVHSELVFTGKENFPGCNYLGFKRQTSIGEASTQMGKDFDTLNKALAGKESIIAGNPFTIYHKWDFVKNRAAYTVGIPIAKNAALSLPQDLFLGSIPATPVYTLTHKGKYQHLGNAWTTLHSMKRGKEINCSKQIHPFESYVNMPGEVSDEALVTHVHFPLKS